MKPIIKIKYKARPKTLAKLKKELGIVLHRFVRLRDCQGYGFVDCISCGRSTRAEELQAGHFIPSTYASVRFLEENIHAQCRSCNLFKSGNLTEYRPRLVAKIGKERVEALEGRRHDAFKPTREWYEGRISFYKSKLQEL